MNDDAFARRFYADRAELESLGITLQVEKPGESLQGYESELYSLPPENYYLPEIRFGDDELAALQTALHLLDGEFAYAEPLRPRAAAGLLGPPEPADGARAVVGRGPDDGQGRRRRGLAAPLQDRDGDLAAQDDRVHLLHDRARLPGEAEGRPVPPGLPRRAVLSDRPLPRAGRDARLPPLADPRQGLLRLQGRARLLAARGLRAPRLRPPGRVAAGRDPGDGEDLPQGADRLAGGAGLRRLREVPQPRPWRRLARQGPDLRDRVRLEPPDGRLGPALAPERDRARSARARRGGRRAPRAARQSDTATTSSRRAPYAPCRPPHAPAGRTAARSRRSARSASRGW